MSEFIIKGGYPLEGSVFISGSKNAALCLIAGALAIRQKVVLNNIPLLTDIYDFLKILKKLNVHYEFIEKHCLLIDARNIKYTSLVLDEVTHFRASYYLIGALLPHFKKIEINYPGGCNFAKRPIDIHLQMFLDYGAKYVENDTLLFTFINYKNYFIKLKNISFGATVNAILMGLYAGKEVIIDNISQEVEIDCLLDFIKESGGNIKKEQGRIIINKNSFHDVIFSNIPDRMEIGTFAFIAASRGKIRLFPIIREHIKYLEDIFNKLGVIYYYVQDSLIVEKTKVNKSLIIKTGEYPLFPTDLQPILTSYLLTIKRLHVIKEKIYPERFSHVNELKKMNASLYLEDDTLLINGIFTLFGKEIYAHDLRCGASLLLSSLNAEGITIIKNAQIIARGYENIVEKLNSLGAYIEVKK